MRHLLVKTFTESLNALCCPFRVVIPGWSGPPAQTLLDFRKEVLAKFDIDLTEPWLDLLSFELGSERLNELLVFRAMGKKDFHPVADTLDHIIATHRDEWKTAGSKKTAP